MGLPCVVFESFHSRTICVACRMGLKKRDGDCLVLRLQNCTSSVCFAACMGGQTKDALGSIGVALMAMPAIIMDGYAEQLAFISIGDVGMRGLCRMLL